MSCASHHECSDEQSEQIRRAAGSRVAMRVAAVKGVGRCAGRRSRSVEGVTVRFGL